MTGQIISLGETSARVRGRGGLEYFVSAAELRKLRDGLRVGDIVEFNQLDPDPVSGKTLPRAVNLKLRSFQAIRPHPSSISITHAKPAEMRKSKSTPCNESEDLLSAATEARSKKEYDRARTLYERAMEKHATIEGFLGLCAMESEIATITGTNYDRARRAYARALDRFPKSGKLYQQYGHLFLGTKPEQAIHLFREGLAKDPGHRILHRCLAEALFASGDPSLLREADRQFELASQFRMLDPDSELKRRLVSVLRGHSRGKLALRFFEAIGFTVQAIPAHDLATNVDFKIRTQLAEFVEAYDLEGEIFVRCLFKDKLAIFDVNTLGESIKDSPVVNVDVNPDVVFLIGLDVSGIKNYLYRLLEQPGRQPTIVPISESLMKEVVEHSSPRERFKMHLDEWLYKRNLYEQNFPVSGRLFFGRENELAGLIRSIEAGSPVGLFGLRKVGKTSLLQQLREKRPYDLVVYIDLQSVPDGIGDTSYVYWMIANQLYEQLRRKYVQLTKRVTFRLAGRHTVFHTVKHPETAAVQLNDDIQLLRAAVRDLGYASFKLIIMLDEVERLLPSKRGGGLKGYDSLFAYLRGVSQEGAFVISIITGANPQICDAPQWEGRDNPVFKFYKEVFLPSLDLSECLEMVERLGKGMGLTYTDKALERIYRETGGHPFITRQLCSRIAKVFRERPLRVDVPTVAKGVGEFLFYDVDVFREIMERLARDFPDEKDLLTLIASGVTGIAELSDLIPNAHESLRHLLGYQLIGRMGEDFFIKLDLFSEWITKYWLNATR